jgi:hypothetical protein
MGVNMTHIHKVEKIKDQTDFDSDGVGYIVVSNVTGRPISIGSPSVNLYPGDKAFSCEDNETILKAIKDNKLNIVESFAPKAKVKKQKQEEQKQEETFTTVADSEEQVSVQLGLSDDDGSSSKDEL